MKIDVSKELADYDGAKILDETGKPVTVRILLRMYVGSWVPKTADEAIIGNAVGLKIHQANGEVDLTGEEYEVLKKTIKEPKHSVMLYAQVYNAVEDI